jgi:hypothetical protein
VDNLVEVSKTGTGFMLIKRDVFEKLNAHPAVRNFANDIGMPAELDPYMKTYFDTAVREGRYYSEDWTFCENWRDLGGQIFVDTRVLLKHTGTYTFDFATQDKLYQDLKAIQAPETPAESPVHAVTPEVMAAEPVAEIMASSDPEAAQA